MKRHLYLTGIYLIIACLWISSICVGQGLLNNRPNVVRKVLDGGVQVVRITIKTNPLDQSGRVQPDRQKQTIPALSQALSPRSNSATSTPVKPLRAGNSLWNQGIPRVNQRGAFIQRKEVSGQSQNSNRNSRTFKKLSLPPRTFDFRGNQVRNDRRYEPNSNTQLLPTRQNSNQANNILPDFPRLVDTQGPKTNLPRVDYILPIVKTIKSTTTSNIPTRKQTTTASQMPKYLPQQIPANFIPEFSMINQFEAQGKQLVPELPNYNQNVQTNINNNGYLQSSVNRNPQSSNYNQRSPVWNQQRSNQNVQQSNLNTNKRVSNFNNNQGNYNLWPSNFNTNQQTGQNQQISNLDMYNNNNQQRINQQPQRSNFYNNQGYQTQWLPQVNTNQQTSNQQLSNFNNNQQVANQDLQQQRVNPFQRNNIAMQRARFRSMQNGELPSWNQWPFFGQINNMADQQTRPAFQDPLANVPNPDYAPIANPTVVLDPSSDIGQNQIGLGQGQVQANPQGQLELMRTTSSSNPQPAGGIQDFSTSFNSQGPLNIPGFSNQINSPTRNSQSMRGNTSDISSSSGFFPSFQQRMMMMRTYYERACNIGATLPNGSEPMACNCYPTRECESQLFMYISPATRRDCASRTTGFTCCCEEQRPLPVRGIGK